MLKCNGEIARDHLVRIFQGLVVGDGWDPCLGNQADLFQKMVRLFARI